MGTFHEGQYTFLIISRSLLLRMRKCQAKVVDKIKTHFLCSITFSRKSCLSWNNEKSYGRKRQKADENKTWSKRVACWITKATETHSEYITRIYYLLLFHGNDGYSKAPQCYVIRTLPVLFLRVERKEKVTTFYLHFILRLVDISLAFGWFFINSKL
jgi:hypothetical protein